MIFLVLGFRVFLYALYNGSSNLSSGHVSCS